MLTFLQLSDIHFRERRGDGGRSDGEIDEGERDSQDYGQRELLIEDAREVGERLGGYSAVLVAGDIAGSGEIGQFSQATTWLRNLCTAVGVRPWMVWTIPGNHDVEDDLIDEAAHQLRRKIRAAEDGSLDSVFDAALADANQSASLLAPLHNYIHFADAFGCAFDSGQLHWSSQLGLAGTHTLQLRGLSSALLCAKGDGRDQLPSVIGARQMADVEAGEIVLSMCHHPHAWVLDGEALDRLFGEMVQVRVTGHLHRRTLERTDVGVYLQAGAVSPNRLPDGGYPEGFEPTYDVITLRRVERSQVPLLEIAVRSRRWNQHEKRWEEDEDLFCAVPLGERGTPEVLAAPPSGQADQPEAPLREARYRFAQMPQTDKFDCLERIGAPLARFADEPDFALVSAVFRWAEDNEKLDLLIEDVNP